MKKHVLWLPLAALVLVVAGCSSGGYSAGDETGAPTVQKDAASAGSQPTAMSTAGMAQSQRKVIRNAELSLRVEDVEKAERLVSQKVVAGGGYVESSSSSGLGTPSPSVEMTLRVPASGFDDALAALAALGHTVFKQVDAKDVTSEIVDLGARIKTLSAKEETFREMLRSARNINDVMALQDRLTEVRTEIERMEAHRQSLSALAALSTIKLSLSQDATLPTAASGDPDWFTQNLGAATTSFVGVAKGLVGALTWLVVFSPFWLTPLLALAWIVRRLSRRAPPVMSGP